MKIKTLTPELRSYPETLLPLPASPRGVSYGYRRVVRNLFRHKSEPLVIPHTFERFPEQWIEGFMASPCIAGSIAADREGDNPLEAFQGGFCVYSFLKQLRILQLLAQPL